MPLSSIASASDQISGRGRLADSMIEALPIADRGDDVSRALLRFIGGSKLRPGDQLPTERQLMASLAVGRSTVREAISRFQALGVLEVRKGSGTFLLRATSVDTIHVPLAIDTAILRDGLLQTLDVRRGLEAEASAVAAMRANAADIVTLEEKLSVMESVHLEKGTAGREDLAFHLAIYDATHNPLFRQLLEQIRDAFERFFDKPFDRPDFARRSFPFHRELFDAIRVHDAALARTKTLAILDVVEDDIKAMSR